MITSAEYTDSLLEQTNIYRGNQYASINLINVFSLYSSVKMKKLI